MDKPINKKILTLFLGVIFIFFVGFIALNEYVLLNGERVYLKTVPLDPRDILRGDYIILSYEIEQDTTTQDFIKNNELKKGDTVYFHLNKDAKSLGMLDKISLNKPEDNIFYIKGVYNEPENLRTTPFDLGIGKFYVPEGRGREVERIISGIEVLVSIEKNGIARVVDLYHEGEKIDFKKEKLFE